MNTASLETLFREGFAAMGIALRPDATDARGATDTTDIPCITDIIDRCVVYVRELRRWNEKINLTGHTREREIVGNLFMDSLACTLGGMPDAPSSVLDVGSGAGFPGLPLRMVSSHSMTLLEPNLKKVAFLHHVIGLLGLRHVRVEAARIEEFSARRDSLGQFDRVLVKALRWRGGLSYVSPVLAASGQCVLWGTDRPSPASADFLAGRAGADDAAGDGPQEFFVVKTIPYTLPFGLGTRRLSVVGRRRDAG